MSVVLFKIAKKTTSTPIFDRTGTPTISIIPVTIREEKNAVNSLKKTLQDQDFELNTHNLLVINAKITAHSQLKQFAINTFELIEKESNNSKNLIRRIYDPQLTIVERIPKMI